VSRSDLHLELHIDSNPRLVSVVRRFIEEALEKVIDDDEELVGRLSIAAHELVENGVKYAVRDPTIMRIVLDQGPRGVDARIAVTNEASAHHVERVRAIVGEISRSAEQELPVLYETYLRRREPHGESGLGLVRIRAEAEMTLALEVAGTTVTIVALAQSQGRLS
jgi:anti-sigma regulatory factor (Ser/Thr protein kinase)